MAVKWKHKIANMLFPWTSNFPYFCVNYDGDYWPLRESGGWDIPRTEKKKRREEKRRAGEGEKAN